MGMKGQSFSLEVQKSSGSMLRALAKTGSGGQWKVWLISVAYATTAGARQIIAELSEVSPQWRSAKKIFLLGLDWGLTEPNALRFLGALPNTKCHIYKANQILSQKLRPVYCYHPKVYAFGNSSSFSSSTRIAGIFGSSNLTGGGLGKNVEACIRFAATSSSSSGRHCIGVIRDLERIALSSDPITDSMLDKYAQLRPKRPKPEYWEPVTSEGSGDGELDASFRRALKTAKCFWTQTLKIVENRGAGRPGNQVDLKKGARAFFGSRVPLNAPANAKLVTIQMEGPNGNADDYAMRYGNNGMDKVNLPLPGQGNPHSYANRYLMWERLPKGLFKLYVEKDGSAWRKASTLEKTIFSYFGGRRKWGFFGSDAP